MDAHRPRASPTRQEAQEQLAAAQAVRGSSARDRAVHAAGTAALGLMVALFMATQNLFHGRVEGVVRAVVFFTVCLGGAWWVERAARTVPRRSRLWSRLGVGATLVVSLVVVLPWLNLSAQTKPNTWPMALAGGAAAAVPTLFAVAAIARRRP